MKLTKTRLKQIIKEEIKKVYEGFTQKGEEGVIIDLYEFTNLAQSGEGEVAVSGVDKSAGVPVDMSLTLTLTEEPPAEMLRFSDKVFVPTNLFGQPVAIKHPELSNYSFVVNF